MKNEENLVAPAAKLFGNEIVRRGNARNEIGGDEIAAPKVLFPQRTQGNKFI